MTGDDDDEGPVTTGNQIALSDLDTLGGESFTMTIPQTVANFLVADNNTRLVQNPSVRATDGVQAQIHIGSRVPVASGSFQPAFAGATGTPVVQFQYIDVGVNMDITPRVLLSREVSLQVQVQVQATAGTNVISGVALPVFTTRSVNHTIRLNEGETNILGGLITNTESDQANGIPGLNRIPGLKYLFSSETTAVDQTEIIVLLTPHIVRMPDLFDRNLEGLDIGPENDTRLRQLPAGPLVLPALAPAVPEPAPAPETPDADPGEQPDAAIDTGTDALSFANAELTVEEGESTEVVLHIDAGLVRGAEMTIEFDPETVTLTDVRDGGFMSQGGASISIARNIDTLRGTAVVSVERSPESPSVSGEGEVLRLVVEGVRPGNSVLRIGGFRVHDGPSSQRLGQVAELIVHVE
jgi:general secretion pathway protein D